MNNEPHTRTHDIPDRDSDRISDRELDKIAHQYSNNLQVIAQEASTPREKISVSDETIARLKVAAEVLDDADIEERYRMVWDTETQTMHDGRPWWHRAWWRIESWWWRITHWLRRDKGEVVVTDDWVDRDAPIYRNEHGVPVRYVEELPPDFVPGGILGDNERDQYTLEAPKRDFDPDGQAQALVIAKRTNRPVLTVDGWVVPDVGYKLGRLYGPTEAKNGAPAITMQAEDIMPGLLPLPSQEYVNRQFSEEEQDSIRAASVPAPAHHGQAFAAEFVRSYAKPRTKRNRKGKK